MSIPSPVPNPTVSCRSHGAAGGAAGIVVVSTVSSRPPRLRLRRHPSQFAVAGAGHGTLSPRQRDIPACVHPGTDAGTHERARPDGRTSTTACGVRGGCCRAHRLCAGGQRTQL